MSSEHWCLLLPPLDSNLASKERFRLEIRFFVPARGEDGAFRIVIRRDFRGEEGLAQLIKSARIDWRDHRVNACNHVSCRLGYIYRFWFYDIGTSFPLFCPRSRCGSAGKSSSPHPGTFSMNTSGFVTSPRGILTIGGNSSSAARAEKTAHPHRTTNVIPGLALRTIIARLYLDQPLRPSGLPSTSPIARA